MTPSYLKYNYFKLKLEWSVRCESNASDFIKAINLHTDDKIILWWDVIKHSQTLQLFLYIIVMQNCNLAWKAIQKHLRVM